jgi:hypothetical protein
MTTFYCLRFETPSTWRARAPYLYPPGTGCPVIPPSTGFHFRRFLRLAGLRWRYSNPLPSYITTSHGLNRKYHSPKSHYCCLSIRCRGNLFVEPLINNGRLLSFNSYSGLHSSCRNIIILKLKEAMHHIGFFLYLDGVGYLAYFH